MKIRKDSWHYKYVAKKWDRYPKALCWYFWKVMLSLFLYFWIAMAALGGIAITLFILATPIWVWFQGSEGLFFPIVSSAMWIGIGAISLNGVRKWEYESGRLERKPPKVKEEKDPGLLSQYIHSVHRKVCPLLEYEENFWDR